MAEPFIIMCAPNGARRQKSDHAMIPLTPTEMADCAEEILEAGASILHLHVRDKSGNHSLAPELYQASIKAVKDRVGDQLIIQITTEAVGVYARSQQMEVVHALRPEAVSLALKELCPNEEALPDFADFITWMRKEHIFPQYILYCEEDYRRFERYRQQGVLGTNQPFALFVMGSYSDDMSNIPRMQACAEEAAFPWAVCGFSEGEEDAIRHASMHRGHARVGFENNIWRKDGSLLGSHAEMVRLASEIADTAGRPVASADDVRRQFALRR